MSRKAVEARAKAPGGPGSGSVAVGARSRRGITAVLSLCLGLGTLAAFGPLWWPWGNRFGFVNVDDPLYVTENPHVESGLSWTNAAWAVRSFEAFNWHPVTWWSLQLDAALAHRFRPGAYVFHVTNVALHVANSLLLFWALLSLTGAEWRSALVAGLFAVHPLRVESVAWVSERKDVLSVLFWMLVVLAYGAYVHRLRAGRHLGAAGFYLLTFALFALGLGAKPMLVTLPFVLLLLDYWPLDRLWLRAERGAAGGDFRGAGKRATPKGQVARAASSHYLLIAGEKAVLLALVAFSVRMTLLAQRPLVKADERFSPAVRLGNALEACLIYIRKLVLPTGLAEFYPHPGDGIRWAGVIAAGACLVTVTALVLWQARRRPYLLVGWFWYLGTLVPVLGLVQVGLQAYADRYTYVPEIGLAVMAVWGVGDLWGCVQGQGRAILSAGWAGAVTVLAALAACTWHQLWYWQNSATLWERTWAVTPVNAVTESHLGYVRWEQGNLEDAETHLSRAVELDPSDGPAWNHLGIVQDQMGKREEAEKSFLKAVATRPDLDLPWFNLGALARSYASRGDYRRAVAILERALRQPTIRRRPDMETQLYRMVEIFRRKERIDKDGGPGP